MFFRGADCRLVDKIDSCQIIDKISIDICMRCHDGRNERVGRSKKPCITGNKVIGGKKHVNYF